MAVLALKSVKRLDDLQWKQTKNFATKHFMERVKIYNDEGFEYRIYNVNVKG